MQDKTFWNFRFLTKTKKKFIHLAFLIGCISNRNWQLFQNDTRGLSHATGLLREGGEWIPMTLLRRMTTESNLKATEDFSRFLEGKLGIIIFFYTNLAIFHQKF